MKRLFAFAFAPQLLTTVMLFALVFLIQRMINVQSTQAGQFSQLISILGKTNQRLDALETKFNTHVDASLVKDAPAVNQLDKRLKSIESTLEDSAGARLGVLLLRKDLDNLRDGYKSDIAVLREQYGWTYDLNRWLLGAIAVSLIVAFVQKAALKD
jgi:hypothetical protein